MHRKLKEYAEEKKIAATRAKMIMYILYNFLSNFWRIIPFEQKKGK